jgi:hypothetical protein
LHGDLKKLGQILYGCQQQFLADHGRVGGGVWDQFWGGLHGRHRPAGRDAGDDRPGQRGFLAAEEVLHCLGETWRQSQAYLVGNINQSSLDSLWNKPDHIELRQRVQDFDFSPLSTLPINAIFS